MTTPTRHPGRFDAPASRPVTMADLLDPPARNGGPTAVPLGAGQASAFVAPAFVDLSELAAPFGAGDVEWRVQQSGKKPDGSVWAKAVCYITNRAVMQRLDEVVGPGNWRNDYREWHGGATLCGLSLRVGGEWVTKWDGAEAPDTEPVKGALSASMKRAAAQWGIGRYLGDVPADWCQIVEKGTRGAQYASAKTKEGTRYDFHWIAPELPRWAVPTEDGETPEAPDMAEAEALLARSCWSETERVAARGWLSGLTRERFTRRVAQLRAEVASREASHA